MNGPDEWILLLLRAGAVALLYLFLISLMLLIQRELRAEGAARGLSSAMARLIVIHPGSSSARPGQTIVIQPVTRLGRGEGNTVVLDDEYVSGAHAMLLLRDGRWWIQDVGSTNGTLVNGARILVETALQEGDELQIGGVLLKLVA